MSFSADTLDDFSAFIADMGESISYTRAGAAAETISAIVDEEQIDEATRQDGTAAKWRTTIHFPSAALAGAAAIHDTAVFRGRTWDITPAPAHHGVHRAECVSVSRSEVSRPDLRRGT